MKKSHSNTNWHEMITFMPIEQLILIPETIFACFVSNPESFDMESLVSSFREIQVGF